MRIGSSRGPRTWPTLQRTSPASSKRGKRATNSSIATFSSRRARFEPRQRWMPSPNAAWRFCCAVDDERVRVLELVRIAVGRRERQQHPVVLLHRTAVEVDVLGDHAGHRDRRVGAEELLERERHDLGLVDQALRSSGCCARCHSDEPIADHVVSMPATSSRMIIPPTMSSLTAARRSRRRAGSW